MGDLSSDESLKKMVLQLSFGFAPSVLGAELSLALDAQILSSNRLSFQPNRTLFLNNMLGSLALPCVGHLFCLPLS